MHKTLFPLIAVVCAATLLGACGSGIETARSTTTTEADDPEPDFTDNAEPDSEFNFDPTVTDDLDPDTVDAIFVETVRNAYPTLFTSAISDDEIIETGFNTCLMFDSGSSVYDVFAIIIESTSVPQQQEAFGFLIGAAVIAYCPEYQPLIEAAT